MIDEDTQLTFVDEFVPEKYVSNDTAKALFQGRRAANKHYIGGEQQEQEEKEEEERRRLGGAALVQKGPSSVRQPGLGDRLLSWETSMYPLLLA